MRSLAALPKANLHLHLTGAMRPGTRAELAARHGLPIPAPLPADVQHGWAAFQDRYDAARCAVRTREIVMRVVREAIADNAADGAGWVKMQSRGRSAADPHAGFYEAARHVRDCVERLGAHRIGHGVTAAADPATVDLLGERGVASAAPEATQAAMLAGVDAWIGTYPSAR